MTSSRKSISLFLPKFDLEVDLSVFVFSIFGHLKRVLTLNLKVRFSLVFAGLLSCTFRGFSFRHILYLGCRQYN